MDSIVTRLGSAELLFRSANRLGLRPAWLSPNGLIVVQTSHGEMYISQERSSLNSQVSANLAANKYYTRLILGRHKLPNIPFARPKTFEQAAAFLELHDTIIIKPLKGAGSKGIHIVSNLEQLKTLELRGCIAEAYIPGREMRYLVLRDTIIAVHESKYGASVAEDRALERVSYEAAEWDSELARMALKASSVLGLSFAAVDFMITEDGTPYILEVNTKPGFKWFHAPSSGPMVDVAGLFLSAMLAAGENVYDFPGAEAVLA